VVKTRVHDLAAEFGISPEQLLGLLKDMNIFVRSHMSPLENDQVSAVRVRWEREKRKHAEDAAPKRGRRKAAPKVAEPPPAPAEARPAKRRRTAAEVAQVEAQAQAEREAAEQRPLLELERAPVLAEAEAAPTPTLEERARALFRDLPPAPAETEEEAAAAPPPMTPPEPVASAAPGAAGRAPFIPPRIQRPAPAEGRRAGRARCSAAAGRPGRPGPARRTAARPSSAPLGLMPKRARPARRARRASARW
jgi:translation initiation factor IF-2